MPKKKTNKAAAKRFRKTATGKYKFKRPGSGHLLGGKTRKRKRALRKGGVASTAEKRRLDNLLAV
jgi:large subunit ribosomal protein L35